MRRHLQRYLIVVVGTFASLSAATAHYSHEPVLCAAHDCWSKAADKDSPSSVASLKSELLASSAQTQGPSPARDQRKSKDPPPSPSVPPVPKSPEAAVEWVNAYFNGIDQLTASFVQTSPDSRLEGRLAFKPPTYLEFAYAAPSTLELVSDGRSVAVRDKKLGTNDV